MGSDPVVVLLSHHRRGEGSRGAGREARHAGRRGTRGAAMSIALIGGAGEGLGAALGRRFEKGGYEVILSSRTKEGPGKADLREEAQVSELFERVERRAPVEVAIFNAGANFRASILDTPADMFEKVWRLGC